MQINFCSGVCFVLRCCWCKPRRWLTRTTGSWPRREAELPFLPSLIVQKKGPLAGSLNYLQNRLRAADDYQPLCCSARTHENTCPFSWSAFHFSSLCFVSVWSLLSTTNALNGRGKHGWFSAGFLQCYRRLRG